MVTNLENKMPISQVDTTVLQGKHNEFNLKHYKIEVTRIVRKKYPTRW